MDATKIRDELLREHAELSRKIRELRETMALWSRGDASRAEVLTGLSNLAVALRAHNAREERLLGIWLRSVDAWGGVRAEIMSEEHFQEHSDLLAALTSAAAAVEPAAWQYLVEQQLKRVLDHMAREERVFLNETVMRDDPVAMEHEGG
jgi:hypothetical protein